MEIKYYDGKRLDCVKVFTDREEFKSWLELEANVGNHLVKVSDDLYKCSYKIKEAQQWKEQRR